MISGYKDKKTVFSLLKKDLVSFVQPFTITFTDNFGNFNKTVVLQIENSDDELVTFSFCVVSDPLLEDLANSVVYLGADNHFFVEIKDSTNTVIYKDLYRLVDNGFIKEIWI